MPADQIRNDYDLELEEYIKFMESIHPEDEETSSSQKSELEELLNSMDD